MARGVPAARECIAGRTRNSDRGCGPTAVAVPARTGRLATARSCVLTPGYGDRHAYPQPGRNAHDTTADARARMVERRQSPATSCIDIPRTAVSRSEEHTSELQSRLH